jgi:hypothetical protein
MLGGITGALTTPADLVVAKYFYQNDPMVDFSYRSLVGMTTKLPSAIHFLWNEQALSSDHRHHLESRQRPGQAERPPVILLRPAGDDDDAFVMGCEASLLTMHVRGASGGHPYPDRNGIMFFGKGRPWFTIPGNNSVAGR